MVALRQGDVRAAGRIGTELKNRPLVYYTVTGEVNFNALRLCSDESKPAAPQNLNRAVPLG